MMISRLNKGHRERQMQRHLSPQDEHPPVADEATGEHAISGPLRVLREYPSAID